MALSKGFKLATKVPEGWTEVQVDAQFWQGNVPKVPRVRTESWRWTRRSKRLCTNAAKSNTKSKGCRSKSKGMHKWPKAKHEVVQDSTRMVRDW